MPLRGLFRPGGRPSGRSDRRQTTYPRVTTGSDSRWPQGDLPANRSRAGKRTGARAGERPGGHSPARTGVDPATVGRRIGVTPATGRSAGRQPVPAPGPRRSSGRQVRERRRDRRADGRQMSTISGRGPSDGRPKTGYRAAEDPYGAQTTPSRAGAAGSTTDGRDLPKQVGFAIHLRPRRPTLGIRRGGRPGAPPGGVRRDCRPVSQAPARRGRSSPCGLSSATCWRTPWQAVE